MSAAIQEPGYCHRIKSVRKHHRLSQTEMAESLGCPLRSYQNYERGERHAPLDLLRALYEEFNVCPIWFLTGKGGMFRVNESPPAIDPNLLTAALLEVTRLETGFKRPLAPSDRARLVVGVYEKNRLEAVYSGDLTPP